MSSIFHIINARELCLNNSNRWQNYLFHKYSVDQRVTIRLFGKKYRNLCCQCLLDHFRYNAMQTIKIKIFTEAYEYHARLGRFGVYNGKMLGWIVPEILNIQKAAKLLYNYIKNILLAHSIIDPLVGIITTYLNYL